MKIALGIFAYFPFGGLQTDMRNIALELAGLGADVTIYAGEWRDSRYPENVKVKILPLSGWSNHARALDFAAKFHRAAHDADVKVAFNRFGGCDFYFAADDCFASALEKKRGAGFLKLLGRYRIFARLEREIFTPGAATRIFYIARKQIEDFQAFYHTPENRFIYLGPGVGKNFHVPENAERLEARKRFGILPEQKAVFFLAANWKLKGGDRVLEAFSRLPESMRETMCLNFVGGDANGEAQKLAASLKIAGYCRFHGPQKDVVPYLHAADVLIHPARKEATGGVIAEALACGVPVIPSGLCGYSYLAGDSGAGIVLPEPFTQQALIEAWENWFAHTEDFAVKARQAAETLDLKSRPHSAALAILSGKQQ